MNLAGIKPACLSLCAGSGSQNDQVVLNISAGIKELRAKAQSFSTEREAVQEVMINSPWSAFRGYIGAVVAI